jgi:peptidoglycan hydrolase FlgJ
MDSIAPVMPFPQTQSTSVEMLGVRAKTLKSNAEIDKTAREFERMALAQMLSLMETDTDISESMFGGGAAERAFRPFLTEEYAKGFSEQGGIGIATAVKREMLKIQERAQAAGV